MEHLEVLHLPGPLRRYSAADIQRAWKKATRWAHPDKGGYEAAFQAITASRDALLELLARGGVSEHFECEECFGKHPNSCTCQCETCRKDEQLRRDADWYSQAPCDAQISEERMRADLAEAGRAQAEERAHAAQAEAAEARAAAAAAEARAAAAEARAAAGSAPPPKAPSNQYYAGIKSELLKGRTVDGRPLTPQMVHERMEKLRARPAMAPRFQAAWDKGVAALMELHKEALSQATAAINAHTTAEAQGLHSRFDDLEARLGGKLPPRAEGQSASSRKREIDEVLPRLRQERKALVQEERAAKARRSS